MSTSTNAPSCRARTKEGSPCRARPAPGSSYCVFHDPHPQSADRQAQGRREGGRARSRPRATLPPDQPDLTIANVRDVCPLLSVTINQVRKGLLDPRIANTVGYLAGVLIRALEVGDIEERLAKLEAATQPSSTPHSGAFNRTIAALRKEPSHVHPVEG